jgi:hypothetical protein
MTPLEGVWAALEAAGSRRDGRNWQCPSHEDRQPSLSVSEGRDGTVLFKCHAGCATETVVKALGLELADLFAPKRRTAKREITATYRYVDEQGALLFEVVRYVPKAFSQRRRAQEGDPPDRIDRDGWVWSMGSTRRVLYRLPKVVAAVLAGEPVYVAEGERDVHALEAAGVVATCNPMGAGKWREEYGQTLAGATVVVVADADSAGRDHARTTAASLERAGSTVRVVEPAVGKDAADHLAAGKTLADLRPLDKESEAGPVEDGAELLDELYGTLSRFVAFPGAEAAITTTLWVAATHAQLAWEHATRLVAKSPVKRCGKSRLLDLLAELCHNPLATVNISVAALVRSIGEDDPPTVLMDEADTVFARRRGERAEAAEDLRGILNAGHQRGRPYVRWDASARGTERCPTFAMAAVAGIGDLPDTIEDRAVVLTMRRRAPGEKVASFRRRRDVPALHELRDRLHAWVGANQARLQDSEPAMPVEDRAADVWEPLIAIADAAGGGWSELARDACRKMTAHAASDAEGSLGERLLVDLRTIFGDAHALWTATIIERLAKLDEAPWNDYFGQRITDRSVAKLLRPYGIRSRDVKVDQTVRKGYYRADLHDAWRRYATPSATSATSATSQLNLVAHGSGVADGVDSSATPLPSATTLTSEVAQVAEVADGVVGGRLPGVDPADPRRFTR